MSIKKSRKYDIDETNYVFDFDGDKLVGIKEEINGVLTPIPPKGNKFANISTSDEGLNAYNIAKYGPNKEGYADAIEKLSDEETQEYYTKELKKLNNQQFVDNVSEQPIAFESPREADKGYKQRAGRGSEIMAYPLDIDLNQDHFKITRYKYIRPDINQSKSQRQESVADGFGTKPINVAGDSVIGSKLGGSIILPMPKATDVNGVEWGGSDLTATGLFALGAAQKLDETALAALASVPTGGAGAVGQEALRAAGVTFGTGTATGISGEQLKAQRDAKKNLGRGDATTGNAVGVGQAITAQAIASGASLFGADIDTDVFLARTGGRVLNPNAEMLFQGPVIRDFNFSFLMIARSEKEGSEIRKIIKWFKKGMAPKFRNTTLIKSPDIFTLEYRNAGGLLKTVNRFNPGGLALTTVNVDYAPSGYWSAYRDSQPVSVKMDLNFTELRPIYQKDQEDDDVFRGLDSVGF